VSLAASVVPGASVVSLAASVVPESSDALGLSSLQAAAPKVMATASRATGASLVRFMVVQTVARGVWFPGSTPKSI
jgi:hypothetical protein